MIGEDDLMDETELSQEDMVENPPEDEEKEEEEEFRRGFSSLTWTPRSNVRERGQKVMEKEAESRDNVPYINNDNSPNMVVGRIRENQEKTSGEKRRLGGQRPRVSRVNSWMGNDDHSMDFPDDSSWPPTSASGARGKKAINRDWTRISKRGRETEGNWHPYKRDALYR